VLPGAVCASWGAALTRPDVPVTFRRPDDAVVAAPELTSARAVVPTERPVVVLAVREAVEDGAVVDEAAVEDGTVVDEAAVDDRAADDRAVEDGAVEDGAVDEGAVAAAVAAASA